MSKARNTYVDFLKACLMISVIMGHTATAVSGGMSGVPEPWKTLPWLGRLFDMPLFMAVAGYFFYSSCSRREFRDVVFSRVTTILFPCLAWLWIWQMLRFAYHPYGLQWVPTGLWFLWSLLGCSLVMGVLHYSFSKMYWMGAMIFIAVSFIVKEDTFNIAYMFPFFFGGYLVSRFSLVSRMPKWVGPFSVLLLIVGYAFHFSGIFKGHSVWTSHSYIFGPLGVMKHLTLMAFRFSVGMVGCIAFPWLLYKLYQVLHRIHKNRIAEAGKNLLLEVGVYSLSYYCIQSIVVEYILHNLLMPSIRQHTVSSPASEYPCIFSCVCAPCTAFVMILCCHFVLKLIRKNKTCSIVLCGK